MARSDDSRQSSEGVVREPASACVPLQDGTKKAERSPRGARGREGPVSAETRGNAGDG
jgi:hypothetical protein